jgi:hypothetical protein
MFYILEHIMSFGSKSVTQAKMTNYEERISCLNKLVEIQKNLKSIDEECINVLSIEGKLNEDIQNRIKNYTNEYKKEYEVCEKIIKY